MKRPLPRALAAIIIFAISGGAMAQDLPTVSGTVHYDPLAMGETLELSSGGDRTVMTSVTKGGLIPSVAIGSADEGYDGLDDSSQDWVWETRITNPIWSTGAANFKIRLDELGTTLRYDITLDPGASVYWKIVFDEQRWLGGPDTGGPFGVAIIPPRTSTGITLEWDTSIVEAGQASSEYALVTSGSYAPTSGDIDLTELDLEEWRFTIVRFAADIGHHNAVLGLAGRDVAGGKHGDGIVQARAGATLDLQVFGGTAGARFLLLGGTGVVPGGLLTPFWGGSIDLVDIQLVGNGIAPITAIDSLMVAPFEISAFVPCSALGTTSAAFPAIVEDPTNPPFFLRNTAAGAACFEEEFVTVYHDFTNGEVREHIAHPCHSISFAGNSYGSMFIGENGLINFGQAGNAGPITGGRFFNGMRLPGTPGANPGVGTPWGRFDPTGGANDHIVVVEDMNLNETRVTFLRQAWASGTAAGSWSTIFNPAHVFFACGGLLPGDPTDGNYILGVTDGDDTLGTNTVLNISSAAGSYTTTSPPETLCEVFNQGTNPWDLGNLIFVHMGGYSWAIL